MPSTTRGRRPTTIRNFMIGFFNTNGNKLSQNRQPTSPVKPRKTMKPLASRTVSGLLVAFAAAFAARAADSNPTVDSILAAFVEASGGKAAIEKIKSRQIKGDIDIMNSTSAWTALAKPPNKQLSEFSSPDFGAVADGFDGTVAWSKNQSGVR